MTGQASGCKSDAVQEQTRRLDRDAPREGRAGRADGLRAPARRRVVAPTRSAAGAWLADAGDRRRPRRWCRRPTRTQQTWQSVAEGAGWDLEPELDRGLYAAGAGDRARPAPDRARRRPDPGRRSATTRPWRRSPSMLDDGDGDGRPRRTDGHGLPRPARSRSSSTTAPGPTCRGSGASPALVAGVPRSGPVADDGRAARSTSQASTRQSQPEPPLPAGELARVETEVAGVRPRSLVEPATPTSARRHARRDRPLRRRGRGRRCRRRRRRPRSPRG